MPIRMVAPPKREKVVNCDWMPILWNQRDEEIDAATGQRLCAQLEATLDCMTSRAIRSMAGLVKRYLHILSVDVAVVIAKPDGAEVEDEPSACLGLWRFNHIDVSQCPHLPDRFVVETDSQPEADVLRVSRAIGALSAVDPEELTSHA
jgi:16S rRNA G527 N7-methylase RsmG